MQTERQFFYPVDLWEIASQSERDTLAPLDDRLRTATDRNLLIHVQCAQFIEVFEDEDHPADYKSWPKDYQINNQISRWQSIVSKFSEQGAVDRVQRANYMRVVMGENDRHKDIAHGLSGKMTWDDKSAVTARLLAIGRNEFDKEPIPVDLENENNFLHVAVSYRQCKGATLSYQQAEAIWMAVRAIVYVEGGTQVRVWLDQLLHRVERPKDREWYEFGLVPCACLPVVVVGDGKIKLQLAYTRPWLWVELITALKGDGVHLVPGVDAMHGCETILEQLRNYPFYAPGILTHGWMCGPGDDVDSVMSEVMLFLSFWRRSFLSHSGYEFADTFERFVNWARLFVIRGVPYSEMSDNPVHRGDVPVQGMDAVQLIRSLPRSGFWVAESKLGLVRPIISWKSFAAPGEWVVGDLVDRTEIDRLPISAIAEYTTRGEIECSGIQIIGSSSLESIRFQKQRGRVSMVYDHTHLPASIEFSRRFECSLRYTECLESCPELVILKSNEDRGDILTYKQFTKHVQPNAEIEILPAIGGILHPGRADTELEEELQLTRVGLAYSEGICEQVYEMSADNSTILRLSAGEVTVLFEAAQQDLIATKEMALQLKTHQSYKSMLYQDMTDDDKRRLTCGWPINIVQFIAGNCASGAGLADIQSEIYEALRAMNANCVLVHVTKLKEDRVMLTFRTKRTIVLVFASPLNALNELALVECTDLDELVNNASTGIVQMASGIAPRVKVKEYGAGLNPRIIASESGEELFVKMVNGLFARCHRCNASVCLLNALKADVVMQDHVYRIQWQGPHDCVGHKYIALPMIPGVRIV